MDLAQHFYRSVDPSDGPFHAWSWSINGRNSRNHSNVQGFCISNHIFELLSKILSKNAISMGRLIRSNGRIDTHTEGDTQNLRHPFVYYDRLLSRHSLYI